MYFFFGTENESCNTKKIKKILTRSAGIVVYVYPCLTACAFTEIFKSESLVQIWHKLCQLVEHHKGMVSQLFCRLQLFFLYQLIQINQSKANF